MRHGYAGDPSADPKKERDRELLPEGIATVKAVVRAWQDTDDLPKVIFCSPFARAQHTADIVGKMLKLQVNVIGDLAPMRPLKPGILSLLSSGLIGRVLLVCHKDNTTPAFQDFKGDSDWTDLVMGEVRRVSMDRKTGSWCLKWSLKPSDVGYADRDS